MPAVLDFTKPHILRNTAEYEAAVERVDALLRAKIREGSSQADELLFLSVLIEEFEDREYEIEGATPQQVVDFVLEQRDMTRADLAGLMGGRSRVSDFFSGERSLSKAQALKLHEHFRIPLEALLRE